ncbi:BZ3501_MvSof-1269-A2-R1_Chr12-3g03594 [Microbotryum saponariae]|nr:BZ3501_MvSof-1269-A2-R1_Chr12-3g03594 [Microbotryum saponariae]
MKSAKLAEAREKLAERWGKGSNAHGKLGKVTCYSGRDNGSFRPLLQGFDAPIQARAHGPFLPRGCYSCASHTRGLTGGTRNARSLFRPSLRCRRFPPVDAIAVLPTRGLTGGTRNAPSAAAFTTCRDRCVPHSQDYLPADEVADREFHLAGRSQLLAARYETLDVARLEPFAVLCTNRAPTVFIQCLAFVAKLPFVIPPTIPVYHQEVRPTLCRLDQSLAVFPRRLGFHRLRYLFNNSYTTNVVLRLAATRTTIPLRLARVVRRVDRMKLFLSPLPVLNYAQPTQFISPRHRETRGQSFIHFDAVQQT